MIKRKTPDAVYVHVGHRLRIRRKMLGMSQEKLGEACGLTFQQIQRFEKGKNRIGADRLRQAADILGVTVSFFFEGGAYGPYMSGCNAPSLADVTEFAYSGDGLRFIRAFTRISRVAMRSRIIALVRELAGPNGE
jgi:transcriptional regulator with XRE-family HTH domain